MKKEKIILIEPNTDFSAKLSEALRNEGYTVATASTGAEGYTILNDLSSSLVLLEVTLPDMDGYAWLERVSQNSILSKTPVFLLSSQGVPLNMRKVPLNIRVDEYIMALNLDVQEVVDRVNRKFGHEAVPIKKSNGGGKKQVLWVEDDKLIGTILAKKLISSGFDLFHAKSGEEALESLKQAIPDIIVLDLLLPGMNGFDVMAEIQKDSALKGVPILILSNLSKPSDIDRARLLGASKFMIKATASLDQIVQEIGSIIEASPRGEALK